jgi:hypothetical protein
MLVVQLAAVIAFIFGLFINCAQAVGSIELSSLDGTNGFALKGASSSQSGWSISNAGDFNGDGCDDILIGALATLSGAGSTYLVYGGAAVDGTTGAFELSSLDGTNGFVLNGV